MVSTHDTRQPPLNVEQIVAAAADFSYDANVPLKYWIRSASTLLKEAEIYEHEGNDQQTYLLLYRHAELVVKYLCNSPESQQSQHKPALAKAKRDVSSSLKKLEILKPRIKKRYERYEQLIRQRDSRRLVSGPESIRPVSRTPDRFLKKPQREESPGSLDKGRGFVEDKATSSVRENLSAVENRDLAVEIAHREIHRRAQARRKTTQAGVSRDDEHARRTAGVWADWETVYAQDARRFDATKVVSPPSSVRTNGNDNGSPMSPVSRYSSQQHVYPKIASPERSSKQETTRSELISRHNRQLSVGDETPPRAPAKIPQHIAHTRQNASSSPIAQNISRETSIARETQRSPPLSTTSSKALDYSFKSSAFLESGAPLRTLFLPPNLRNHFLSIAQFNTSRNLETCGILCGTLIANALFVSKLVIPEQESTSDTCETINESALFDYVDGEDLMVLGWIHTHPTQTCFMSSRDLHTHSGYQVMMPESIAIVCAPSKQDWGIFRLTDPPGLKAILNCNQTGLFHPHAESHIYTDALRPGHVHEAKGLQYDVVDMRAA